LAGILAGAWLGGFGNFTAISYTLTFKKHAPFLASDYGSYFYAPNSFHVANVAVLTAEWIARADKYHGDAEGGIKDW
jgi:hypothetical protein